MAFSPTVCHIDLGAIVRNFGKLGTASSLMPVIKSDAYGHGLLPVAKALSDAGARQFAVGIPEEGVMLRKAGFKQEILHLLTGQTAGDWQNIKNWGIIGLVGNWQDLQLAAAACESSSNFLSSREPLLKIAIACDTGMGRLGFSLEDVGTLLDYLHTHPFLKPMLCLSHLACADMPEEIDYTRSQIKIFQSFTQGLREYYPDVKASLANSAACLAGLKTGQIARPGFALYGGDPFCGSKLSGAPDLEWAMSVSAPIINLRKLKAGQSVSYGRIFTAPRDMDIAIVAAGYANGYNRALSNRAYVLLNGLRAPQIGRICMGMMMIDISHISEAKIGDRVWLMGGPDKENAITALDLASLLNTIPYEILCLMGSLNAREYV